ncbi:hypothetical protein T11_9880 [Trichinella zimbabwensis]|uniref:Uncharacterized protein n=1 Tax=Trichinella zimbabwensis TaxID=268475 RepID=A0A0V1GVL6_9BILA|nr:hypothetical protein T11_9880 [Trichinella zimbabwensis]
MYCRNGQRSLNGMSRSSTVTKAPGLHIIGKRAIQSSETSHIVAKGSFSRRCDLVSRSSNRMILEIR